MLKNWYEEGNNDIIFINEKELKSMGSQTGGEGLTDTPLVPVEHSKGVETKPMGTYKDFNACVRANQDKENPEAYCGEIMKRVEAKSVYQFDNGQYVLTATSPEEILKQAVELCESQEKAIEEDTEEYEEHKPMKNVIDGS
jgi:hypothetical protein